MALTDYTLPEISTHVGTYRLTVQVENAGLSDPVNTTVSLGTLRESADSIPGVVEVSNLSMQVIEDYDDYAQGWWGTVIEPSSPYTDDVRLKVELDSGSGYELIFWGKIDRTGTSFQDVYLSDGKGSTTASTHVRVITLAWIDLIVLLKETPLSDFRTEVLTHTTTYSYNDDPTATVAGGSSNTFATFEDIIASMVASSFGQAFASSDCVVLNSDIKFKDANGGSSYVGLEDLHLMVSTSLGYYATSSSKYIVGRVASVFDYLTLLCRNFGVIARRAYTGSRHTIEIGTRGRSYADYLTFAESPTTSTAQPVNPIVPESIYVHWVAAAGGASRYDYWFRDSQYTEDSQPEEASISFDIDQELEYTGVDVALFDAFAQLYYLRSGNLYAVNSYQYYDYTAGATATADRYDTALVKYLVNRYDTSRLITRTYQTLVASSGGAASTFASIAVLRRHQDNDGGGSRNYFARMVERDLTKGTTTIEWIEE